MLCIVDLEILIETMPAAVSVKKADDLSYVRINRASEMMLGMARESVLGKTDFDLFPPTVANRCERLDRDALAGTTHGEIPEERFETPSGPRYLFTRRVPVKSADERYLLAITVDITDAANAREELQRSHGELERRVQQRTSRLVDEIQDRLRVEDALSKTEDQLRHAQKMEAIGRLAGGIAHDFNNLLSVILSYSDLVFAQLTDPQQREDLDEIRKAGLRAAGLTKQLLAFSRKQILQPKLLDLNDSLSDMHNMVRSLMGEGVALAVKPGAGLYKITADPSQIEQVVMNLIVNARDAMPNGGRVMLETANVELDEQYAREHVGTRAGPHAMLAVSDTGSGMDKETLTRIFEPFFTTKEQGKGTGLGLSTVFGIVQQSGGSVWFYSELGIGTTCKIYFPRSSADLTPLAAPLPISDLRGSETILMVEDESQVRSVAGTILQRYGYRIIAASAPEEALSLIAQTPPVHIDMILSDVVMPGMSGPAMVEKLLPQLPDVKVLFMSGYTDEAIVHHGVLQPGVAFLQKPFTPEALARRVREVLGVR